MVEVIPDSEKTHWVNRAPVGVRPYLQLSRLDRPVGYWLLALPGWIGLAFAGLRTGLVWADLGWAVLILIGAIAMRGAGCTYNDIIDRDLDAQVARTALRPLPAGTVTLHQAWTWLFAQVGVGFAVWLCLPLFAKGIALLSIPLVAAYPFMKRITWFPQVWLGLTFNWAVLVAYAVKTGSLDWPVMILYLGLMFWTVGYDTIYACQDIEDDAMVGIKSSARAFGGRVKLGVGVCYLIFFSLMTFVWMTGLTDLHQAYLDDRAPNMMLTQPIYKSAIIYLPTLLPGLQLCKQVKTFVPSNASKNLEIFKSNVRQALYWLVASLGFWLLTVMHV